MSSLWARAILDKFSSETKGFRCLACRSALTRPAIFCWSADIVIRGWPPLKPVTAQKRRTERISLRWSRRARGILKEVFPESSPANRTRLSGRSTILDGLGRRRRSGVDSKVLEDGFAVLTPFQMVVFLVIQFAIAAYKCPDTGRLNVFEFQNRPLYVNQ